MSPQNRVDTPRPAPAPHCCRHTASDNICRVPGDTGHSVASLGTHADGPQNIQKLYNLWVTGNTITTVVKRQEDK